MDALDDSIRASRLIGRDAVSGETLYGSTSRSLPMVRGIRFPGKFINQPISRLSKAPGDVTCYF
jgi:hypothetical protein